MIEIKTRLHEGIYKSSGGGKTTVHYTWTTGPRNLMAAIETLREHSADMTQGYGNVGHSGSWIEVDGIVMRHDDLSQYEYETDPSQYSESDYSHAITRTEWCKQFIAKCKDRSIIEERRRTDEYVKESMDLAYRYEN